MLGQSPITLDYSPPELAIAAGKLADRWGFVLQKPNNQEPYLSLSPAGLALETPGSGFKPMIIDFASGKLAYRQHHLQHELILRACGTKEKLGKKWIVDLTAGLGRDALLLASAGHRVLMIERSPILAALLEDALKRLGPHTDLDLELIFTDASIWLKQTDHEKPDIIYCDPMHPSRQKSALVKKEMRIIRDLVGEDEDSDELLMLAIQSAKEKVIVKRPRLAPPLGGLSPHHQYLGTAARFDVYLCPRPKM